MAMPIQLALVAVLIASAPNMKMKWALWQQQGFKSSVVEIYSSKVACEAQLASMRALQNGWIYSCRPR